MRLLGSLPGLVVPVALALGLVSASAPAAAARRASSSVDRGSDDEEKIHVVGPGQTLAKIAKRYHVSVQALRDANDLAPGQRIKPGTRLVIPSADGDGRHERKHAKGKTVNASLDTTDRDRDRDRDDEPTRKKGKKAHDDDRDDDRDDRRNDAGERFRPGKHGNGVTKPGHVHLVRGTESWDGRLFDKKGKISAKAADAFARLLSSSGGKRHEIEPRLITLVGMVSDHFHGRTLEVVSGFRPYTKTQYTPHSRHNLGAAIDFHVRGVSNEELREYRKTFRNTGVGFYPNSSFVHLDVRESSTTWIDYSHPGEAPHYNHPDAAKDADESASDVLPPEAGKADSAPSGDASKDASGSKETQERTGVSNESTTKKQEH